MSRSLAMPLEIVIFRELRLSNWLMYVLTHPPSSIIVRIANNPSSKTVLAELGDVSATVIQSSDL